MSKEYYDPIYDSVNLSDLQVELMNSEELMTTRDVTSLGMSLNLYRSASGERYEHNIGVSICASILGCEVNKRYRNRPVNVPLLQAAGMLHDIGHLPFSHAADAFFTKYGLRQENESVRKIRESDEIKAILEKHGVPIDQACDAINHPNDGNHVYWRQLISGFMDADRLDFLRRDSLSVVPFGQGIKLGRIRQCICIEDNKIYYEEGARGNIEHFLEVYTHMYQEVYHNKKTKVYEEMLNRALELKKGVIPVDHIRNLSEQDIKRILLEDSDGSDEHKAAETLARMIFKRPQPYEDIFAVRLTDAKDLVDLKDKFPKEDDVGIDASKAEEFLSDKLDLGVGNLIVVSCPIPPPDLRIKTDIYIRKCKVAFKEPRIVPLEELTEIPLPQKYLHKFVFRVLCHPDKMSPDLQERVDQLLLGRRKEY